MRKIALTLATAAGVVALSAGPASAASPVDISNATSQAQSNWVDQARNASNQMNQMQQDSSAAAAQRQEVDMQMNAYKMAANATKAANDGQTG
jgi:hypothetical protein